MASKKELRRLAIEREQQRRSQVAINDCPISREEFSAMVDHVSDHLVDHGHDHDFAITTAYLVAHDHPVDPVIRFLTAHRITDDWSLLISGDPYGLFGATAERSMRMPLEEVQLESLIQWLDTEIQRSGCDHTHKLTRSWLREHGFAPTRTIGSLMALGGFCDCEVALNVETEGVYPQTNSEQGGAGQPAARSESK